jgi:hypothetical protein
LAIGYLSLFWPSFVEYYGMVYPFLALSAVGFAAMLVVHVASLFGVTAPFAHGLRYLAPGVFVVFLPAILVMNRLTQDFKQKDTWRAALRGCPQWMRRAVWVMFGYAWVGFFALPFLYGGAMDSEANKARSMSGILLMFLSDSSSGSVLSDSGYAFRPKQTLLKRPPSLAVGEVLR